MDPLLEAIKLGGIVMNLSEIIYQHHFYPGIYEKKHVSNPTREK